MQTYILYAKKSAEKFIKVCSWITSCYTNGQIDNLEHMVLPWFSKTRILQRALIDKMQVQRAVIAAYPQSPAGWANTDEAADRFSDDVQPDQRETNS